jgi:hypothetical protein
MISMSEVMPALNAGLFHQTLARAFDRVSAAGAPRGGATDRKTERRREIGSARGGFRFGEPRRDFVAVNESVAAAGDPVGGHGWVQRIDALLEEFHPIVGRDPVQDLDNVLKVVGMGDETAVVGAEKLRREVVERFAVVGELADPGVGVKPDQLPFGVVVFRELPAHPAHRPALRDRGLVGGVGQGAPLTTGAELESGGETKARVILGA